MVVQLLRFSDLAQYGVNNWPTLKRWIAKEGFPPGRYLAANTRVWMQEEVRAWFDSRPLADPPPEIVKPAPSAATEGSGRISAKAGNQSNLSDKRIASDLQAFLNGRAGR
jgi:predicted DNA-binding transcriptional regulator AlpA